MSPSLIRRTPTTAKDAPRSTAHHGLYSEREIKQVSVYVTCHGFLLPSTAFDGKKSPSRLVSFHTLLAKVGRLSATLKSYHTPVTAPVVSTLVTITHIEVRNILSLSHLE